MTRIPIILAALVAASPLSAASRPVALQGDHAVCSRIEVIAQFVDTRVGQDAWTQRLASEVSQGRCAVLPTGTRVYLEDQVGMFTCVRPVELQICGWTVMNPKAIRRGR